MRYVFDEILIIFFFCSRFDGFRGMTRVFHRKRERESDASRLSVAVVFSPGSDKSVTWISTTCMDGRKV